MNKYIYWKSDCGNNKIAKAIKKTHIFSIFNGENSFSLLLVFFKSMHLMVILSIYDIISKLFNDPRKIIKSIQRVTAISKQ